MHARSRIEVRLFGTFSLHLAGEPVTGLDTGKVQELLCYLLLHRDRAHSRDILAGALWADHPTAQAKKYLRQALWQLQTALKPPAGRKTGQLLHVAPDYVAIDASADLWLDIAAFEEGFAGVEDVPDGEIHDDQARRLRDAAQLYRGELLGGYYDDWCFYERERLQGLYLAMLDKLMAYSEARRQYDAAIGYGARSLRCDPAREQTHQRLMVVHYLAGNRSEALRQYERCVAALEQELDVAPARRTVEIYDQIRADQWRGAPAGADPASRETASVGDRLANANDYLRRLGGLLTEVAGSMTRVEREIRLLEQAVAARDRRLERPAELSPVRPLGERRPVGLSRAASDA